jgi:Protein of unknown function (DUF2442)
MALRRLTDAEILQQIPPACEAEHAARKRGHRARAVRFDRAKRRVVLELSSGVLFAFPVAAIPSLRRASPTQLAQVMTNASGSTLRWDALDVDVSVAGLLLAAVDPAERVRYLASLAGRATSLAKATAARVNGAKGGRPRTTAVGANAIRRRKKIAG